MIRIESNTLEEAYAKASSELGCSITEITIDVIQNASPGFLGMFKKTAIIEARYSNSSKNERPKVERPQRNNNEKREQIKQVVPKVREKVETRTNAVKPAIKKEFKKPSKPLPEEKKKPVKKPRVKKEVKPKIDINLVVAEIKENVNNLFQYSCFSLEKINVEVFNEDTVLVEFEGEDAALLIGKEGYRYKSLSYLLYNWINVKYDLNVRLEIAEFLKNQEEMIEKYLVGVVERINNTGRAQTKILDGVLVKIALESLRKQFPQKYVGIKSGREGGKFIVINDFNRKT
jgi:spoIIIJ-associated protein